MSLSCTWFLGDQNSDEKWMTNESFGKRPKKVSSDFWISHFGFGYHFGFGRGHWCFQRPFYPGDGSLALHPGIFGQRRPPFQEALAWVPNTANNGQLCTAKVSKITVVNSTSQLNHMFFKLPTKMLPDCFFFWKERTAQISIAKNIETYSDSTFV